MALLDPSTFLGSESEVPQDVRFQVVDREGVEEEGEVMAHRILLSAASPVFRKMFFVAETHDRRAAVIVVRDTSKAAFQAMVAAIYSKQPKAADLATLALVDVFELAALAGRYEVLPLEAIAMEHMHALPVPAEEEGLMEVAETCLAFAHLEVASAALLRRCAAALRRATRTVADTLQFASRYQGIAREPVAMALLARMAEVPAPPEEGRRYRTARVMQQVLVNAAHANLPNLQQLIQQHPNFIHAQGQGHQGHHAHAPGHNPVHQANAHHNQHMLQMVQEGLPLAPVDHLQFAFPPIFLHHPAQGHAPAHAPEVIDVGDAPEPNQVDGPVADLEIIEVNMEAN